MIFAEASFRRSRRRGNWAFEVCYQICEALIWQKPTLVSVEILKLIISFSLLTGSPARIVYFTHFNFYAPIFFWFSTPLTSVLELQICMSGHTQLCYHQPVQQLPSETLDDETDSRLLSPEDNEDGCQGTWLHRRPRGQTLDEMDFLVRSNRCNPLWAAHRNCRSQNSHLVMYLSFHR